MALSRSVASAAVMVAAAVTLPLAGAPAGAAGSSTQSSSTTSSPGITAKTVTIGQVDDLSKPLPGLFKSAEDGTQAYVDYINSLGGVNGRKLILDARDSQFDSSTVVSETKSQIQNDFALVGGFSLLDQAEAPVINAADMPDIAYPLSTTLANDPHVYSPSPSVTNAWPVGFLKWFKKKDPQATQHVGILYGTDTPSEIEVQNTVVSTLKALGYKIAYQHGISATTTSFLPDVIAMKNDGVQLVYNTELPTAQAATLAKELQQQNLKVTNVEIAAYAENLAQLAGSAGNGMLFPQLQSLYQGEDSKAVPEVALFNKWVRKVDPKVFDSTEPITALYGWTSAMLFAQALKAAGPNPTRASLVAQLNKVTNFNGNGLLATGANVAANSPPTCWLLAELNNGKITRVSPSPKSGYICNPGGTHPANGWHPESR